MYNKNGYFIFILFKGPKWKNVFLNFFLKGPKKSKASGQSHQAIRGSQETLSSENPPHWIDITAVMVV